MFQFNLLEVWRNFGSLFFACAVFWVYTDCPELVTRVTCLAAPSNFLDVRMPDLFAVPGHGHVTLSFTTVQVLTRLNASLVFAPQSIVFDRSQ